MRLVRTSCIRITTIISTECKAMMMITLLAWRNIVFAYLCSKHSKRGSTLKSAKQWPPPRKKKSLQGAHSKQTYRPTQELDFLHHFTKTKVQLFLGSPKSRLQLLTLRIQLQQFIIHFLCGFSVVFCNLGCSRVCCFQPMAFAKPTWRNNKSLLAECLLHIVECPMRKP